MFPDRSACCITISQEIWPKQSCLNCGSSFLSPAIYKARSASIDHPPSSQTKVLPRLCAFTHFRFKEKLQPANCIMMNNRVTLPPISDIFTNKNVGALPQQQPQFAIQRPLVTGPAPPAYAAMPVYLYQYMYNSPPHYHPSPYGNASYTPYVAAPASGSGSQSEVSGSLSLHRGLTSSERRPLVALPTSPGLPSSKSLTPETSSLATRARTRNNLPKETTYIFLKWLNDHLNHPYPNSFEKTQLMMTTGLNQQQLSNWFINARRRKIKLLRQKKQAERS